MGSGPAPLRTRAGSVASPVDMARRGSTASAFTVATAGNRLRGTAANSDRATPDGQRNGGQT